MNCLQCNSKTTNSKFCNNSCSAKYNNSKRRRKVTTKTCKGCGDNFSVYWDKRARVNCDSCVKNKTYLKNKVKKYQTKTVKELKAEHSNKHSRPWTDRVRGFARNQHSHCKSQCVNCGYSLHVEICHIKAIVDFPDSSTISEINHRSNIAILCRNCHWEFDNGLLTISS